MNIDSYISDNNEQCTDSKIIKYLNILLIIYLIILAILGIIMAIIFDKSTSCSFLWKLILSSSMLLILDYISIYNFYKKCHILLKIFLFLIFTVKIYVLYVYFTIHFNNLFLCNLNNYENFVFWLHFSYNILLVIIYIVIFCEPCFKK